MSQIDIRKQRQCVYGQIFLKKHAANVQQMPTKTRHFS